MKYRSLTLLPSSTASASPGGGGPGALPGLPAPLGVNGFGSLTPQTNGQPGSDTIYNNGLSPYPGGSPYPADPNLLEIEWEARYYRQGRAWGEGIPPSSLLPFIAVLHLPHSHSGSLPWPLPYLPSSWALRPPLSPSQSPGVADPLQQAYAGIHQYAGFTWHCPARVCGCGVLKGLR